MRRTAIAIIAFLFIAGIIADMGHAMGPRPSDMETVEPALGGKPGSPVSVTIEPVSPVSGDIAELLVTVRSSVASDAMRVKVTLTGGAELLSGERSMSVTVEAGEDYAMPMTIRLPEGDNLSVRASVRVTASLKERGGRYSGSAVFYPLGPPDEKPSAAPKGEVRTDSRGRRIIEHRGQ